MKPKTIKIIITSIGITLFVISAILSILFYVKLSDAPEFENYVDFVIKWAYFLGALAAIIAFIIVPIFSAIQNPKKVVKFAISLGVFLLILVISYAMSNGSGVENINNVENFEQQVRWVDTGLHALYILTILGLGVIVFSELKSIFKK